MTLDNTNPLYFKYNSDSAFIRLQRNNNGTWYNIIRNHNNGNVSISAAGDGLYLGYENTNKIYCRGSYENIDSGNISTQSVKYATSAGTVSSITKAQVTNALGYTPPTTNSTYNFSGTTFRSGGSSNEEHNANNAWENGHYYYTANGPSD